MMMKGIAASPIDQADIGIGEPTSVIVEAFARPFEHVGQARDGNVVRHRIDALRQISYRKCQALALLEARIEYAVTIDNPAAG